MLLCINLLSPGSTTLWTIDGGSRGPFVNRYGVVNLRLQANHGRCSNLEIIDQQYVLYNNTQQITLHLKYLYKPNSTK